jgi:hypothetical protein
MSSELQKESNDLKAIIWSLLVGNHEVGFRELTAKPA